MSRPWPTASALAAVALAALAAAAPAHGAPAPSCAEPRSWVGGTTDLCAGTLVYDDYVDDDYGADTGTRTTSRTAALAPSAGDQGYPSGEDATADLIRLQLRLVGGEPQITGLLNALYQPDTTTLAVAIDTDDNSATGGGKWGQLDVSSRGWDEIAFFTHGDPQTNTITGTMPLPPGRRWRIQAATAISSSGQVMNVAFRGPDERARFGSSAASNADSDAGSWFEDEQAKALGSGDISEFGYTVNVDDLRNGVTRTQPVGPGLHERVYTSDYEIPPGEGQDPAGVPGRGGGRLRTRFDQSFQYLGPYQPYGIYIPRGHGPFGMQMVFHGSSSSLSGLINQPGMEQRFGEGLHRILVVPEARGEAGWGSDISERDLLDVMDDVEASYPVDRDQVVSSGYSQGGYIAYRMAELYPQRFAGVVDWVGYTGAEMNGTPLAGSQLDSSAGAVGNVLDLVGNLRSVPTVMLYGGEDELVHAWTARAMDQAFAATDDVYRWYFHPLAEHLTFAVLDDWRKEAAYTADLSRVHDPPQVTYWTSTVLDDPAVGIVHDRAYWVSQIRGRSPGYENVDLFTHACGGTTPVLKRTNGAGTDPVPWVSDDQRVAATVSIKREPLLTGSLGNVASLSIDPSQACLRGAAFEYDITTDGPATVSFSDGRSLTFANAGRHSGTLGTSSG